MVGVLFQPGEFFIDGFVAQLSSFHSVDSELVTAAAFVVVDIRCGLIYATVVQRVNDGSWYRVGR